MSFVRPEIAARISKWREVVAGLVFGGLGLYLVATTRGAPFLIGVGLMVAGGALIVAGVQRGRFRRDADGPGLVRVVEGRVTYFGPFDGGSVSIERLAWLELDQLDGGAAHWTLIEEDGHRLEIPVSALGNDMLFDAFSALPGLKTEHMLASLENPVRERRLIWQRDVPRLH